MADQAIYVTFGFGVQGTRLTVTQGVRGPVLATVQFTRTLSRADQVRVNAAVRAAGTDRLAIATTALEAADAERREPTP